MTQLQHHLRDHLTSRVLHRTPVSSLSILLIVVVYLAQAGFEGAIVGGCLLVAWTLLPAPYTVVIGHLGALVVIPAGSALHWIVLLELGCLGILVGEREGFKNQLRLGRWVLGVVLGFGILVGLTRLWTQQLWHATVVAVLLSVWAAYTVHRYERTVVWNETDDSP